MSVVFIVGSEKQLSSGIAWCKTISDANGEPIKVAVTGADSKVLLERSRRKLADALEVSQDRLSVESIESSADAILQHLKATHASAALMIYTASAAEVQQVVFEKCGIPAIWLQVSGPPPETQARLFAGMSRNADVTSHVSQRLFAAVPPAVLPDPFEDAGSFEGNGSLEGGVDEPLIEEVVTTMTRRVEMAADRSGDLVLVGVATVHRDDPVYRVALRMLENECATSLGVVRGGESLKDTLGAKIKKWSASVAPPMDREQRIRLANDLESGSLPNLEFLGLISASSMLAAFGLLQDSAAVVIGAMLIAPLMTPILGAGLALTHGNRPLFRSSLVTITMGFFGALLTCIAFGLLVRFLQELLNVPVMKDIETTSEMWARCRPSPLDFCVGLVGGMAASYARTRSHLSSALAGAAIAAALVPPIATAGLQIAFGEFNANENGFPIIGPILLVSVNVLTIMIGSSFILWARGIRADRKLSAKDRWAPRMTAVLTLMALLALVYVTLPK